MNPEKSKLENWWNQRENVHGFPKARSCTLTPISTRSSWWHMTSSDSVLCPGRSTDSAGQWSASQCWGEVKVKDEVWGGGELSWLQVTAASQEEPRWCHSRRWRIGSWPQQECAKWWASLAIWVGKGLGRQPLAKGFWFHSRSSGNLHEHPGVSRRRSGLRKCPSD